MVFNDKMMVMQVRPQYSIQYQFKPFLKLSSEECKSKKDFLKYIKDLTINWKDGDYFIRCNKGTFAYFSLEGNKVKLHKKSERTGNEYLCWQFFQDEGEKVTKKESGKKKN